MTLQREYREDGRLIWRDVVENGKPVKSPVDIDALLVGVYRLRTESAVMVILFRSVNLDYTETSESKYTSGIETNYQSCTVGIAVWLCLCGCSYCS